MISTARVPQSVLSQRRTSSVLAASILIFTTKSGIFREDGGQPMKQSFRMPFEHFSPDPVPGPAYRPTSCGTYRSCGPLPMSKCPNVISSLPTLKLEA